MQIVKFELSGTFAFFKNPEVNTNGYFTYSNIHKVALRGIFGSILGLKGYNQQLPDDEYPEFYNLLKDCKIGVVPVGNVCPDKKIQVFNNSTLFHNIGEDKKGANLIVYEEWIENPRWDIYIQINKNNALEKELMDRLVSKRFVYVPYLGKNDHFANIENVKVYDDFNIDNTSTPIKIDSFYYSKDFTIHDDYDPFSEDENEEIKMVYKEFLPCELSSETNHYILKPISYSENKLDKKNSDVDIFNIEDKNIVFI